MFTPSAGVPAYPAAHAAGSFVWAPAVPPADLDSHAQVPPRRIPGRPAHHPLQNRHWRILALPIFFGFFCCSLLPKGRVFASRSSLEAVTELNPSPRLLHRVFEFVRTRTLCWRSSWAEELGPPHGRRRTAQTSTIPSLSPRLQPTEAARVACMAMKTMDKVGHP